MKPLHRTIVPYWRFIKSIRSSKGISTSALTPLHSQTDQPNSMQFLPANETHFRQVLSLNKAAVPHVNLIEIETLQTLASQSIFFYVALDDVKENHSSINQDGEPETTEQNVLGFLIALDEKANYNSPNFQYFKKHFQSFVYVDRIVISENHRGKGIGRELYSRLRSEFDTSSVICCEVNIRPPNPESHAFHQSLGFEQVGVQDTEQGMKSVSLMTMKNDKQSVTTKAD